MNQHFESDLSLAVLDLRDDIALVRHEGEAVQVDVDGTSIPVQQDDCLIHALDTDGQYRAVLAVLPAALFDALFVMRPLTEDEQADLQGQIEANQENQECGEVSVDPLNECAIYRHGSSVSVLINGEELPCVEQAIVMDAFGEAKVRLVLAPDRVTVQGRQEMPVLPPVIGAAPISHRI